MADIPNTTSKPVQQALRAWAAAVEALMQDVNRIASGGELNPVGRDSLMAAVEAARWRCENVDPCNALFIERHQAQLLSSKDNMSSPDADT